MTTDANFDSFMGPDHNVTDQQRNAAREWQETAS